jgi:aspartate aminotransferase-like enzyme
MSNSILLAPGPVQLHPEVQRILSLPMIHHRTPEFDAILKSTLANLKSIFQTTQPAFLLTATGSGGMECLLVNVLNPKDKVIAIINGKFGERWADMAEAFGANVIRHHVTWGSAAKIEDLENLLKQNPDVKIVQAQACETSTATINPIQEMAELISKTEALFLVDGITALGAYNIPMDAWKIDGLVGGSQKAFMLPTGMAFVSFSEKAWKKIKTATAPKFYFNIQNEYASNLKGETLFSSNVSIIRALDFVLKRILEHGLAAHFKHIARRADYTREMATELGLALYSLAPSNSVTALCLPSNIDGVKFRNELEAKYHVTVMGGQDALKGKIIRLGHMGYITDQNMHETTMRLAKALTDFDLKINLTVLEKKSKTYLEGQV